MGYENPLEHNGCTITATCLELKSGQWRGSYVIERESEEIHRGANAASFDTQSEAEQHTLAMARSIVDGAIPGLMK